MFIHKQCVKHRYEKYSMEMDIESMIYRHPSDVKPEKGDLLIAEPLLQEKVFKRSVIMLLEEDSQKGHVGLVLNKPTSITLKDLFPEWEAGEFVKVYCGGPVESDRLFMMHSLGDIFEGAMEIAPDLYVGAKVEDMLAFVNENPDIEGKMRFFLGYSGWIAGQLSSEIKHHTWALNHHSDTRMLLRGKGNTYWRREVERLGEDYRSWLVVPSDPSFN